MEKITKNILLVEDDSNDALFFKRALAKVSKSINLMILNDGEQAINYLTQFTGPNTTPNPDIPDLIILDLKLPRRSGLEILDWIRNQEGINRLPVLILTSSDQITDIKKAYSLTANSYLVKPIGFENLITLIETIESYWLDLNVLSGTF